MEKTVRILYVEDDETLSFVTRDNLTLRGYQVIHCADGNTALAKTREEDFSLCILDVMLPGMDGFTLAKKIREVNQHIPILFLTARSAREDRILGLKLGADDYLTKPFSMEELILKIEVFLKRSTISHGRQSRTTRIGNLMLDAENLRLSTDKKAYSLTHREAELLWLLASNLNQVVRREQILNEIWETDHFFSSRSLDVFISRLRKLISPDPSLKIETVHNVGYRLRTGPSEEGSR